jgi:hypothetical protein
MVVNFKTIQRLMKGKWDKTIALSPSVMVSHAGITCWPSELSLVYECMASTHVQVNKSLFAVMIWCI